MSTLVSESPAVTKPQTNPISVRADPDLDERLEELARRLGKKRHAIASAALRLGVSAIEGDPERFYQALIEAEKARAAAAIEALQAEAAEAAPKKGRKKSEKPEE